MAGPTTTIEQFQMHPAVSLSLIRNQAESLTKAITETVMNAEDAGATRVDVEVANDRVVVTDDGRGFRTENEIDEYFSTIGAPHVAHARKHGRFRVGRLQIFAHGANNWRTNTFAMEVDFKTRGSAHDVTTGLPDQPGCRIEVALYDRQANGDVLRIASELKAALEWLSTEVRVNGVLVTKDPKAAKWKRVDEDAYFSITRGRFLDVYNQGVRLKRVWSYRSGFGGTIVSKQALPTNAARNDVDDTSEYWKRIMATAATLAPKTANGRNEPRTAKPRFNTWDENLRAHAIDLLLQGQHSMADVISGDAGIAETALNPQSTLRSLVADPDVPLVAMPKRTPEGQMLQKAGLATVVLGVTLEAFGVTDARGLLDKLADMAEAENAKASGRMLQRFAEAARQAKTRPASDFEQLFAQNYAPRDPASLAAKERDGMAVAEAMSSTYAEAAQVPRRPVRPATSMTRRVWTDGTAIHMVSEALSATTPTAVVDMANAIVASYASDGDDRHSVEAGRDQAVRYLVAIEGRRMLGDMVTAGLDEVMRQHAARTEPMPRTLELLEEFGSLCERA